MWSGWSTNGRDEVKVTVVLAEDEVYFHAGCISEIIQRDNDFSNVCSDCYDTYEAVEYWVSGETETPE